MVVADTSPLNYLILIDHINLLPQLYGRVLIPESVLQELSAIETPQIVRNVTRQPHEEGEHRDDLSSHLRLSSINRLMARKGHIVDRQPPKYS